MRRARGPRAEVGSPGLPNRQIGSRYGPITPGGGRLTIVIRATPTPRTRDHKRGQQHGTAGDAFDPVSYRRSGGRSRAPRTGVVDADGLGGGRYAAVTDAVTAHETTRGPGPTVAGAEMFKK